MVEMVVAVVLTEGEKAAATQEAEEAVVVCSAATARSWQLPTIYLQDRSSLSRFGPW